jgi:muramoyltetrapeptide carboxypeptidase LdcA involved in peptidoglycan recycling
MWSVEPLNWSEAANQDLPRKREPATQRAWLQGSGIVEGPLIGGCAEVLEMAQGSSLWPPLDAFEGAIFFLETAEGGATPESLAEWLREYGELGVIDRIGGLIYGRPGGCIPIEDFGAYDRVLINVAREFGRPDLPIVTRMEFGHTDPIFVLPYGVRARLDCSRREFSILESAVTAR